MIYDDFTIQTLRPPRNQLFLVLLFSAPGRSPGSPGSPAARQPGTFRVKAHALLAVAQEQAAVAGGESDGDLLSSQF